jgi:hypothetical protein
MSGIQGIQPVSASAYQSAAMRLSAPARPATPPVSEAQETGQNERQEIMSGRQERGEGGSGPGSLFSITA